MSAIAILGGAAPTMTSLELVEFINSQRAEGEAVLQHRDFTAKVPKVLGEGVCEEFRTPHVNPQNGQTYQIYRFPKREACLMAMSYSYDLQAKVFDKMTALEQAVNDPMRVLSDPAAMRGLLLGYTEKVIALEVQVQQLAPKAEALDRIATCTDGSLRLRDAAATLQVPEKKFLQRLEQIAWIYRAADGDWHAYSEPRKKLYLEHKLRPYIDSKDGETKYSTQARVTAKGMAKLAEIFEREGAPA